MSSSPLIPFDALSADVAFVLGCIACGWGCFGIWVYYIWTFAEVLKGATPLQASAWICPVAISGAMASISTGFLLGKVRPAVVMTIALTAFTVGTILIATGKLYIFTTFLVFANTSKLRLTKPIGPNSLFVSLLYHGVRLKSSHHQNTTDHNL